MKPVKVGTVRSRIKRGDQVVFIAGKEFNRYDSAGKRQPFRGRVSAVDARAGKVKVEGAMIVKRHRKPMPQMNREGGIFEQEAWVNISNVALIDPETGKPTKAKYEVRDGKKVRVAKSGKVLPETGWIKKEAKKKVDDEDAPAEDKAK
ncbi:MAG: 50S ribosomal protein L24 [Pyrinomonadaceae bacterium]